MMQDVLPVFRGKVYGANRVAYMMGFAPKEMSKAVFVGFLKTRDIFIGTSKKKGNKPGIVRRRIEKRKNWGGRISPTQNSPTWTSQFSSLLKGKIEGHIEFMSTLSLHMGVLYRTKRPINQAMEMMGNGDTVTAKGGMLIIPMYENLQRVGVQCKTGNSVIELKRYQFNGEMFVLARGSKTLFYDKDLWDHGDRKNALMFVGMHSVKIQKQFDIYDQWAGFSARAHRLIEAAVDRGAKRLERKI